MMYLLERSRRPRLFRPARFKKRGGRANRRRCARGDAFQAIVGVTLIAIWGMRFCVEISQARHSCLVRFKQEKYAPATRGAQ